LIRFHAPGERIGTIDRSALWRLVLLGAFCVVAQWALIRATRGLGHDTATTIAAVLPLMLWLAVPAAVLLVAAPRIIPQVPRRHVSLALVMLVGLIMRALWFGQAPPLEDDFQRYMWDGGVLAHGMNPYRYSPWSLSQASVPPVGYDALVAAGRSVLERINFPDLRTMYPSTAQAAFALAHWIAPFKIDGLRVVFWFAELATCALMMALLDDMRASPVWAVLYWWNPLPVFMLAGIAHVDALVPPFVLGALWLANRDRYVSALVCACLGAGVKIWPVLLVPLLMRPLWPDPRRLACAAASVVVALAVAVGPVLLSTREPSSGLAAYTAGWSMHNAFYAWSFSGLSLIVSSDAAHAVLRVLLATLTGATALFVAAMLWQSPVHRVRGALVLAATVFYLSPAQFPWYAVWFLPLAAIVRSWPLLLASVLVPAYYLFFPLWEGRGDVFFYGVSFVHAVPVLGWLAWPVVHRVVHRAAPLNTKNYNVNA
jgi:alpha-1,6-mannosyltransferase